MKCAKIELHCIYAACTGFSPSSWCYIRSGTQDGPTSEDKTAPVEEVAEGQFGNMEAFAFTDMEN